MKEHHNSRALLIEETLIPADFKLSQWPQNLQKHFRKKKQQNHSSDVAKIVSNHYLKTLNKINSRYKDTPDGDFNLVYPWFFPADYTCISTDEGELFRTKIRNKIIIPKYAYPESYLFEDFQKKSRNFLKI